MIPTAASAIRRAEQILFEQVGQKTTLEYGIAFCDAEYAQSVDDNAFREVSVARAESMPQAWQEVETFYAEQGLSCFRWVPALEQSIDVLAPFLMQQGLQRVVYNAMYVPSWPELAPDRSMRILPARAVRKMFRALHPDEEAAGIAERRLDYAQFDVFVATVEGQPAGRCGLLQVGEYANIRDLYVAEAFRRRHVGTTLLAHVLTMARRLMMRIVCLKIEDRNQEGAAFLQACGFERQGQMIDFVRNRTPS